MEEHLSIMNYKKLNKHEIRVSTKVTYEGLSDLNGVKHQIFSYKVHIENHTNQNLKLLSRKWIINDSLSGKRIVEGEGVVGLRPSISSGATFDYDSWCPILGDFGSMEGYFYFINEITLEYFEAKIPLFELVVPDIMN